MAERVLATTDFDAMRGRFPTLRDTTYINSGSYGLLADSVKEAFGDYLQSRIDKGADWDGWIERGERVRTKMARLLGSGVDEIAITASASAGMNAVASALDLRNGRSRIVVSNYEFPTSGQIWHAQELRGGVVQHVPESEDNVIPIERFEDAIDERTSLVVLSHVCYRHGGKFPAETIRQIADIAHRNGAYLLLDCYQSVGAERIDVRALDVDFIVGGLLKYLLGTAGIGFLYVRKSAIEKLMPIATGWFAQANTADMDIFANAPSPTASRFQAGTPPVVSCYAANAALDLILEIGQVAIATRIAGLTAYALERLTDEGFSVATPKSHELRGPMLAIHAQDAPELVEKLIGRRIVTSAREGKLRAGFHFYNNQEDVDRLIDGLRQHRALLA